MRSLLRLVTAALLVGAALACGSAPQDGGSTEVFARRIRDALGTRDPQAVSELYCWNGIDPQARIEEEHRNLILLKGPVKEVSFLPSSEGFRSEFELGGMRYRPSAPIVGRVKLVFASTTAQDSVGGVTLPYAREGERTCFPVYQRFRPDGGGRRELSVGVRMPDGPPLRYSLDCQYAVTGVLRSLAFEDSAPRTEVVNGEFVQSCRLRKHSAGGWVELTIDEGGGKVFESRTESGEPIVYSSS